MSSNKRKGTTCSGKRPKSAKPQPPVALAGPVPATMHGLQLVNEDEPDDQTELPSPERDPLGGDEVGVAKEAKASTGKGSRPEPLDPAAVCALLMVRGLLRRERRALKSAGLVVITVPASWVAEISLAWDIDAKRPRAPIAVKGHCLLIGSFDPGPRAEGSRSRLDTKFENAVLDGRLVVGISPEPERMLPRGLVAAPDCVRLIMPAPDRELLCRVASRVTHRRLLTTVAIPDLGRPTPQILRNARRRRQSPGAWLNLVAAYVAANTAEKVGPDLEQISGMDEVKAWAQSLARSLQSYVAGKITWKDVDRGVLLVGPPGVGKTTVAGAIARHCGAMFIATSYAQWQGQGQGHLGDVQQAIDRAFTEAREKAPCVLFIDEIDAVHVRNSGDRNSTWWHTIVASLLEWLDGRRDRKGVIVIAATNYLHEVDEGLRRSGRLDRIIEIGYPDAAALVGILRYHLGGDLHDADLRPVAERLAAVLATGADVQRTVRDARARARDTGRDVEVEDLLAALENAPPPASKACRWRVAVHEAGHALIRFLQSPGSIRKLTATKQGRSGWIAVAPDREPLTQARVEDELCALLAGRAAEKVILGNVSAGAGGSPSSDLALATALACSAVSIYGLGCDDETLIWRGTADQAALSNSQTVEVRHMLAEADRRAAALIRTHRPAVEAVAKRLLEVGELDGGEAETLFRSIIDPEASPPATT